MWLQKKITLTPYPRGFHLVTSAVEKAVPVLNNIKTGMLYVNILHTSASLSINENADRTVRIDCLNYFNRLAPESLNYEHNYEGQDDMPAHLKSLLLGNSVSIPINSGKLRLGTWQGIYLGEHRDNGGPRSLVITLNGELNGH